MFLEEASQVLRQSFCGIPCRSESKHLLLREAQRKYGAMYAIDETAPQGTPSNRITPVYHTPGKIEGVEIRLEATLLG